METAIDWILANGARAREIGEAGREFSPLGGSLMNGRLPRFVVLPTCHEAGRQQYGRRMVETFDQFLAGLKKSRGLPRLDGRRP